MAHDFEWLNPPPAWSGDADGLAVETGVETDFWRETFYGFTRDSGHAWLAPVDGDFSASLRCTRRLFGALRSGGADAAAGRGDLDQGRDRVHRRADALLDRGDRAALGLVGDPAAGGEARRPRSRCGSPGTATRRGCSMRSTAGRGGWRGWRRSRPGRRGSGRWPARRSAAGSRRGSRASRIGPPIAAGAARGLRWPSRR